jgi:DNA-binding IclR family transcriptional regulator
VRLGPAIAALAGTLRVDFQAIARPHLEKLSAEVRETVILTNLRGRHAVYVDQIVSDRPVNLSVRAGMEFPLHSTAAGKALLATLSPDELADFLRTPLEAYTPQTIVTEEALRAEVAEIARAGFAVDCREHGDHDFALATTVLDPADRPYSISILLPETRSGEDKAIYVGPLFQCRDRIHGAIGRRRAALDMEQRDPLHRSARKRPA